MKQKDAQDLCLRKKEGTGIPRLEGCKITHPITFQNGSHCRKWFSGDVHFVKQLENVLRISCHTTWKLGCFQSCESFEPSVVLYSPDSEQERKRPQRKSANQEWSVGPFVFQWAVLRKFHLVVNLILATGLRLSLASLFGLGILGEQGLRAAGLNNS